MQPFENTNNRNRNVWRSRTLSPFLACLVILFLLGACENAVESASAADAPLKERVAEDTGKSADARVLVTYFHTTFRCPTCRLLEQYSRETVERDFAKEIEEGKVAFRVMNVDDKENRHFVEHYGLYTKSLIVSLNKNGNEIRWKNLPGIWTHVRNRDRFEQYVKEEIQAFLQDL